MGGKRLDGLQNTFAADCLFLFVERFFFLQRQLDGLPCLLQSNRIYGVKEKNEETGDINTDF